MSTEQRGFPPSPLQLRQVVANRRATRAQLRSALIEALLLLDRLTPKATP